MQPGTDGTLTPAGLGTILIVEDSQDDVELASTALRTAGYRGSVVVARDGAEALDMLLGRGSHEGRAVRPQVILLDLTLPRLEGMALLEWIRSHTDVHLTPVVVFSSSDDPADIRGAYARGANAYVRKPVKTGAYAESIRSIVEFWHRVNQVAT
jgi:two-component system, response regulator